MTAADDRLAVIDVIHRWSHVVDDGAAEDLHLVVTDDAALAIAPAREGEVLCQGPAAIAEHLAGIAAASGLQLRRHVRNTVFDEITADHVRTRSYYLITGVPDAGMAKPIAAGVYEDELVRTPAGWRIARRVAHPDGAATAGVRA